MIRVCPHSDSQCPHGMSCTFSCATDSYDGTKKPMNTERCGNCRFRQADTNVCRRYPPTIDVVDNREVSFLVVVFPDIGWCGEWQPDKTVRVGSGGLGGGVGQYGDGMVGVVVGGSGGVGGGPTR